MKSDLEQFLTNLLHVLREIHVQFGGWAWVALGLVLLPTILLAVAALCSIRRGRLETGAANRFFEEQRIIKHWINRS